MFIFTGNSAIGYLHNLSPVKESEKKNSYFDMKLQTNKRTYRAVCFDSDLHDEFNSRYESSSPIKISNCQVRINPRSNDEEIHINKRSKVMDPNVQEIDFDIDLTQRQAEYQGIQVSLEQIHHMKPGTPLDLFGRITFHGDPELVNIRGNKVNMQEAVITDESASVRLVLWEGDINKIESRHTYYLKRAIVKDFNKQNYITLNRQTEIIESPHSVDRLDENLGQNIKQSLPFPPEGVQSIHRYLSCKKCSTSMVNTDRKIVKCTAAGCSLSQLKSSCHQKVQASAFFMKSDGVKHSVLLRDDFLRKVIQIYNTQINDKQHLEFEQLTDDDIVEVVLSVSEAHITYAKNNVAKDIAVTPASELEDAQQQTDNPNNSDESSSEHEKLINELKEIFEKDDDPLDQLD